MLCSSQSLILTVLIGWTIALLPATEVSLFELHAVNIDLILSNNNTRGA